MGVGAAAVNKESGKYCAAGGFLTLPFLWKITKTLVHFSALFRLSLFAGFPEAGFLGFLEDGTISFSSLGAITVRSNPRP